MPQLSDDTHVSAVDDRGWEEHRVGTDADLLTAKQIIEAAS